MGGLTAWLASSALMQLPFGLFLKAVPAWAWKLGVILVLLAAAFLWHQHVAHKAIAAAYAKGKADEAASVEKQALAIKASADKLNTNVAALIRSTNDETNRRIGSAADALRLRGPGKAVCRGSGLPAGASGSQPASRPGNAAVAQVPDTAGLNLIGLPFNDAIDFGRDHDLDRAEVLSWRDWYQKMVKAWPKQPAKPAGQP